MKKFSSAIYYVLGIFSILLISLFIISFNPTLANSLVSYGLKNGDLYQMAKVFDFKDYIPSSLPQEELSSIKDADVIIMGDSFFNVSPGYQYFAKQIQSKTNLKIHNYNIQGSGELWRKTNPLDYLKEANFKIDGKKRILILESVDRGLMMRYENINKDNIKKKGEDIFDKNDKNPPKGAIELVRLNNNHLRIEGWGADEESGSPLKEIIIMIDGKIKGQAITGFQRPDIVKYFKNDSWINSGWSFDADLDFSLEKHTLNAVFIDNNGNKSISNKKEIRFTIAQIDNVIKNKLRSLEYLITENPLSFLFSEIVNTIKFNVFKTISPLTPKYSTNPNVLYYKEEVDHFTKLYTDEDIEKISNYISYLSNTLDQKYNIQLIFVPMPNKYTIYHGKAGDSSEESFLSRLYPTLKSRKVKYVNLLEPFMANLNPFLYFYTDTHLNRYGMDIVVKELLNSLKIN